jgi:hypothetical protein
MGIDRFGNLHAPNLSYARGEILSSTEDDFQKLQRAWSLIRERGPDKIYVFTGLEHSLPLPAEELEFADDEIAPALSFARLKELALDHLGGSPETDDFAVFNRLTGATMATHLTLVKPGEVVIGVSASHSHPVFSQPPDSGKPCNDRGKADFFALSAERLVMGDTRQLSPAEEAQKIAQTLARILRRGP